MASRVSLEPGRRPRGREELIRWGIIPRMKLVALATAAALAGPVYADPDTNAERQARKYDQQGRPEAARLMRSMAAVPQAFWFTGGTPKQVRKDVRRTVDAASNAQAVAVLVAYNVPGRD